MAQTFRSRQIRHEQAMDNRFIAEHRVLAGDVARIVFRFATKQGENGNGRIVPNLRQTRDRLKTAVWEQVIRPYYIGNGADPFNSDQPQSPFARLLYDGIAGNTRIQAERQAAILRSAVKDETVYRWLTGPRPFTAVTELGRGVYEPFHQFVDPKGYRLSDRIWRDAVDARSRIDRLLDYHIAAGTGAVDMAELLEDFLTPGAKIIKTNAPYGTEGSYAARRLARTEITAAAGRATVNASAANPFVDSIKWTLSGSHSKPDICDQNAAGGDNGDGVYPVNGVPAYPGHPHCLCTLSPVVTKTSADLVADLKLQIQAGMPEARRMQGIFNIEWLVGALLSGVIGDVLERITR